jgi:Zn-dependent membrane protease YugP
MQQTLVFAVIDAGMAMTAWILSLAGYQVTQADGVDRHTVLFFGKLWFGLAMLFILVFLFVEYA